MIQLEDYSPDADENSSSNPNIADALTPREVHLLGCMSNNKSLDSVLFWATAGLAKVLAEWGHWLTSTIHHCPCHCLSAENKNGQASAAPATTGQGHGRGQKRKNKNKQPGTTVISQNEVDPARAGVVGQGPPRDHAAPCPMIGRTAVLLAGGLPDVAVESFRQMPGQLCRIWQPLIQLQQRL